MDREPDGTADRLTAIVCRVLNVDERQVGVDTLIRDELGATSRQQIELLAAIEAEFGLELDSAEYQRITDVRSACDVVAEARART